LTSLAALAEDIEVLLPASASIARAELPDCVLIDMAGIASPGNSGAHRLRFASGRVDERIEAVRAWFRDRGRAEFTWWVGPSATPGDLEARLRAAGASSFADEPVVTQMLLTEPPPEVDGFEVRRVERFEEFAVGRELAWRIAGFTEEQLDAARGTLAERWEHRQSAGNGALYLVFVDGEPVACGDVIFLPFAAFLSGASTLPEARGRGAFRALVRARWDEAVQRGTPALLVGAGKMSRPILERLGFANLAELHVLVDQSGVSS
jgi:GNAT superfamily N-acetyltransferase